jgi:myo-inositol-1(or 4)-monophosphatase
LKLRKKESSITPFIKACIKANQEIYRLLQNGFETSWYKKSTVGAGGDVSSRLDLLTEEIFVKHLQKFGTIESEESGVIVSPYEEVKKERIIIDPLDGSSNALTHFPYYGTSIAKLNGEGVLHMACICNLANGDVFIKEEGGGVQKGNLTELVFEPLKVNVHSEVGIFEKAYQHAEVVQCLESQGLKFRAPGAIALSLAYAHSVSFVLFVGSYRLYDFAAGLALCEGLHVSVEPNYVIVSKQKEILEMLESCVEDV